MSDYFVEGIKEALESIEQAYKAESCKRCANNPKNNPEATGICHCTLGTPKAT